MLLLADARQTELTDYRFFQTTASVSSAILFLGKELAAEAPAYPKVNSR